MASARKCDICGQYYDVPEINTFMHEPWTNTSMIRVLRLNDQGDYGKHDVMQFDACEKCLQDVIDYMLARRSEAEVVKEE